MSGPYCDIVIGADDQATLMAHLFPGDRDEHGAILHAGVIEDGEQMKLLVRGVFPARFGTDYVAGQHGYRALHPRFIHQHITACRDQRLAYLAVHNHDCDDRVGFSRIDIASHERGYPALLDIGKGVPVGALVLGRRSMEADVWLPDGRRCSLREARIVGPTLRHLHPSPPAIFATPGESHDRQVRMFGVAGQSRRKHPARTAVAGVSRLPVS